MRATRHRSPAKVFFPLGYIRSEEENNHVCYCTIGVCIITGIEHLHAVHKRIKARVGTNQFYIRDVGKLRWALLAARAAGATKRMSREARAAHGLPIRKANGSGPRFKRSIDKQVQREAAEAAAGQRKTLLTSKFTPGHV